MKKVGILLLKRKVYDICHLYILDEEKAKKFEKVKTPILESIEAKKKEERMRKYKEKMNAGTNQVKLAELCGNITYFFFTKIWVPRKN